MRRLFFLALFLLPAIAFAQAKRQTAAGGSTLTLAAVGSTPNANGATYSGGTFNLEPASGSFPGCLTTTAQTIAGVKTFADGVKLAASKNISCAADAGCDAGTGSIYFNNMFSWNLFVGTVWGKGASALILKSQAADNASAVGAETDSFNAFTTAGGTIHNFKTGGTLKSRVDKDGSYQFKIGTTLPTCAAAFEGTIARDTAGGGTTGHITRLCLCTSDGAGTPVYKWQNIVTATLGNTTTCQD